MNTQVIKKIPLKIKYKKPNGLFVFDLEKLDIPTSFKVKESSLVIIPPKQIGGNHKHPRSEILLAINNNLEIHWLDERNNKHCELMTSGEDFSLFVVPPYVPHAVINTSVSNNAALYELANDVQHDVERISVIEISESARK